jgi:hypothetical protein
VTALGVSAAVFFLDLFYLNYITSHGFAIKATNYAIGTLKLTIPLQWLPLVGVVFVSLTMWYETSLTIFPKRANPETDPLSNYKLLRVIAISLAVFVCVLYIPYIVGSNWFWARMSSASVSPVRDFALSILNTDQSMMALAPIWQYSISQFVALATMMGSAWFFSRNPRRLRK